MCSSARRIALIVVFIIVQLLSSVVVCISSSSFQCTHKTEAPEKNNAQSGLVAGDGTFYLDGRPFRIISGSFHYFRTRPEQWKDRLERIKAGYVNTVSTYIP